METLVPRKIKLVDGITVHNARPRVAGKFIYVDDKKLTVRVVTYGPFHPDSAGAVYHEPDKVEHSHSRREILC